MSAAQDTLRPLTPADVRTLAAIITAADLGASVHMIWLDVDVTGVARHLVRDSTTFAFPSGADDVRNCFLRITTTTGFDLAVPITEVMTLLDEGALRFEPR